MLVLLFCGMTSFAFGQGMSCDMSEMVTAGTYTVDSIPANGNNTNTIATGAVWYSYTPAQNVDVTVSSCLGGADTRLWVYTGSCDALDLVAANDDFCELSAGGDPYASETGFLATAGTTYYIEWDNRWSSAGFDWTLTETAGQADVAAAPVGQFTVLPDSQNELWVSALNLGTADVTGYTLTAEVFDTDDLMTPVASASSTPQDIAFAGTAVVNVGSWMPVIGEEYVITYSVSSADGDSNPDNDTFTTDPFTVSDFTYALDSGVQTNGFGTNSGNEIIMGNVYTFFAPDTIVSVSLAYGGGDSPDTDDANLVIWSVGADGIPVEELYAQSIQTEAFDGIVLLDDEFEGEMGQRYLVGTRSTTNANVNFALGIDQNVYFPGQTLFRSGAGAWTDAAAVADFAHTVRLNMTSDIVTTTLTLNVQMTQEDVGTNGVYVAGSFNGFDPAATEMTDPDGDGIYSVTVDVGIGDTVQYKFLNGPSFDFEESVPMECGVDNGFGGFDRSTIVLDATELAPVCFGGCEFCQVLQDCAEPAIIICEDFEDFIVGSVSGQSALFEPWPGGSTANVVDDLALSGTKSLYIADGGGLDQVLLFPENLNEGSYELRFSLYVPQGQAAYFNIQGDRDAIGSVFKIEVDMATGGVASVNAGGIGAATFDYPYDQWFEIGIDFNLTAEENTLLVDGTDVLTWDGTLDSGGDPEDVQIGGINFFPIDGDYEYYVDDIFLTQVETVLGAVTTTFTVGTEFIDVDPGGMFIAGEFTGWQNEAMTDNADGTWSITVDLMPNDTVEYKFKNGPDGWEEATPGDCTIDGGVGNNRFVITTTDDLDLGEVCFNECVACDMVIDVFDPEFAAGISVQPNPTADVFTTDFRFETATDLNVRLFNSTGQLIEERRLQSVSTATERFDLAAQPAGMYNLVVTDGTRTSTKRVVRR